MKIIKILKFGGSSIVNSDCINKVRNIIQSIRNEQCYLIVVVSALGGVTDKLSALADTRRDLVHFEKLAADLKDHHQSICKNLDLDLNHFLDESFRKLQDECRRGNESFDSEFRDTILAWGELLSSRIIAECLNKIGIPADSLDSRRVILTDSNFGNAFVHYRKSYNHIRDYFKNIGNVQVVTGFIGATEDGKTTTLGRSGSDYTASIIGAALNADEIQIWTDVNGILTADPSKVKKAKTILQLNYEEAMELAHGGAKVIFPPTMIPALYKKIPIWIKNTFNPEFSGTLVTQKRPVTDEIAVGISSRSGVALVRLQGAGMVGLFGLIGRIFTSLATEKINIILVSQVFSEHSVCFVINLDQAVPAELLLKTEFKLELNNHVIDKIIVEKNLTLIALVGEGMRNTPGITGKLFVTLGNHKINVVAIAQGSSERNISFIVEDNFAKKTLQVLHREFFESHIDKIGLFLAGTGTVGSELLNILASEKNPNLQLAGVSNSTSTLTNPSGIDPGKAIKQLKSKGKESTLNKFLAVGTNFKRNIFIDCTTSDDLADQYPGIMSKRFSIVAANKKANTKEVGYYNKIRSVVSEYGVNFRYETNVGAGLPVISTLNSLLNSGDKIHKIEGVLSGTLSYLFNHFNKSVSFSELVKKAKEKGYTEPDPREDLDGMDVARKCLILAREIGFNMELDDVQVESLLPENSEQCKSLDEFYGLLENHDHSYSKRLKKAEKLNKKLRYIGTVLKGEALVKLESVSRDHPFYELRGSENIISITTDRYFEQPLIIKGHGAGAAATAGGVMADIMTIVGGKHE